MTVAGSVGVIGLALVDGALVALPKADALKTLSLRRSPAWAALLPGSIVVGTFVPVAFPRAALALIVLAGVATPLLAGVSVFAVARGPRPALIAVALGLGLAAGLISGWAGELSATLLTALGCLAVGIVLVRLIPRRWVLLGTLGMCLADVALLASGVGQTAATLMSAATANLPGPLFAQASVGPVSTDYPDLVLAAVLGGVLASRHQQRIGALLVTAVAIVYGLLLPAGGILPATVPTAVTLVGLECAGLMAGRRLQAVATVADAAP